MPKRAKRYFDPEPTAEPEGPETSERNEESSGFDPTNRRRTFPDKSETALQPLSSSDRDFARAEAQTAHVDPEKVKKYKWGDDLRTEGVKTKFYKSKYEKKKKRLELTARQAARAELLLSEEAGFLEADDGEETYEIGQHEIADSVDITSATKYFELDLPKFGPYRISYTRNGRHLLMGGRRGHLAALDWHTKKLHCETNVLETVRDVQWLHVETMYAAAQKKWTYIYDNQGVELHCMKQLADVKRLEFLPYHFILAASTGASFLHWLDVSIGKLVQSFPTKEGALDVMCQNPSNAIIHCGHPKGTVTLWSPNVKDPLVKLFAHGGPVRGVTVDPTGRYMATTGMDRQVRVWDIRQYKPLNGWTLSSVGLGPVSFSQRGLLAVSVGTSVQIFKDVTKTTVEAPYLAHDAHHTVTDIKFCPFEDVLGIGHQAGFNSILVPGAGEANIDALEANPYQSKKQRKEWEVKALLDKIQPEMINIDSSLISELDRETLQERIDEKAKILYVKPDKIEFQLKHRMKGKSSAKKKEHRKQLIKEQKRNAFKEKKKQVAAELLTEETENETSKNRPPPSVLDRFKSKR